MQTMFDYYLIMRVSPITHVLVNIVVKGDIFTFYMEYNHGKPCKNPLTLLLLSLKTYVGQVGLNCILLCL